MFRSGFTILAITVALSLLGCGPKEHPKDAVLIGNFNAHRGEFEELLQMFQADRSVGRVGSDFTRSASFFDECTGPNAWNGKEIEITKERLSDYRRRFASLGLPKGIEGSCDKDYIWFYASSMGLSVTGSSKGYVYAAKTPSTVVGNLDDYWSSDGKSFSAFRHLEGNWYLYLEYED